MSTTIRVSKRTHERFARLSRATGRPMTALLDEAADTLERKVFFEQMATRWAELREEQEVWEEIEAERDSEAPALRDAAS